MFANIIASLSLAVSAVIAIVYVRDRRRFKFWLKNDYSNRLLDWHWEVITALSELREFNLDRWEEDNILRLSNLSSLIDQGRFYFPNLDKGDEFGKDKPFAYRGYRNLALDFLVAYYNIFDMEKGSRDLDKAEVLQRHFTSIVFEVVRPKSRLEEIRNLTDKYFVEEKTFEDFLDHPDSSIIRFIWKS